MNETEYLKNFESFGVRYITYDLIQKLCKKDFHLVETLNLNLVNDTNKKFKYFEKLEKLTNLKKLNISFNIIEKIDNIKNLTNLTHLNLSFNKISKIENLEHLILLKNLNLNHNNIETIPTWFQKKLSHLNVFTLCHNRIESIDEIRKLHLLSNLTHVGFVGNAISTLSHYQSFVLVHLRNITKLDSKEISDKEKTRDVALYDNEAIMNCEKEISKYKQAYLELDESFTLLKEKMRIKNYKTNSTQNFEMLRKNEKLIEDLKNKEIEVNIQLIHNNTIIICWE
ncbi:hypothetical protein A3Q56_06490 [Intoshia linei]|uniref:Uncharacterized protein n=1 Tax=Intoshia linei TaxID=1819745 RepID=A0A177AUX5_9BILA|nr:hypothetical protein A3Q56_06490 [Intoshia linei]